MFMWYMFQWKLDLGFFFNEKYDKILLQEIEEYVQYPLSHLNLFDLYDDKLMIGIAEGMN